MRGIFHLMKFQSYPSMNELIVEAIDHKLLISLNLFVNSDLRAVSKISGTVFPNTDLPSGE